MPFIPVLLKPKLLTIKNRWFKSGRNGLKELAAVIFSCCIMVGLYAGTIAALTDIDRALQGASVNPTAPLGMLFAALFVMIAITGGVSGLGSLFMARDLDLTLSSPITPGQFLLGKATDIGVSVSWMVCTFGLPSLVAVGSFYNAGLLFFVAAPLLCVAFFAIAVVIGMIGAVLFAAIIPSHRGKQLAVALVFLLLGVLSATARGNNVYTSISPTTTSADLFKNLSLATANSWLPSTHCAEAVTGLLRGDATMPFLTLIEFAGTLAVLWFALYRVFTQFYEKGLDRVQSGSPLFKIHSRSSQKIARLLFPFSTSPSRAIVAKEYKVFSRDITHTIQLGMLLGITFVYLYNYRLLTAPTTMSEEALAIWNIFLLISNVALGSLVLTSICSRFVYPSVSMEGTAFWLVQSAPVSLREVLTAKFKSWLTPISIIGGVIFISGAMALNADVPLVLASCATGIIFCHGLVGLGIGLGALFSQFEWEHSTQLSMSLGSFIFMLSSMVFLAINLVPIGLMFGTYSLFPEDANHPYFSSLVLAGGLLSTYMINRLTSWWALSAGARALEPR